MTGHTGEHARRCLLFSFRVACPNVCTCWAATT